MKLVILSLSNYPLSFIGCDTVLKLGSVLQKSTWVSC